MTLDEILSQAAGGFNLQALSLDNILRAIQIGRASCRERV